MIEQAIAGILSTQRSKPVSLAVTAVSLFAPAFLLIFLSRPELFQDIGLNGVMILSVSVSVPIVLLCVGLWYMPMALLLRLERMVHGRLDDSNFEAALEEPDPIEWPSLLMGSWTANIILFVIAAVAYHKPVKIGATLLSTAIVLTTIWLLIFGLCAVLYVRVRDKARRKGLISQTTV